MSNEKGRRLLLIGWDAADWRVINPLIDAGKMPNLQRLVDRGTCGNLATLQPVLSPMLWTSIATGKRPYKHGVHGFSEPDPISGSIRPVTSLSRKTKAIWNILHQEGLRPGVVGWWPSHPTEPLSNGFMVSNHYQRIGGEGFESWGLDPAAVYPERLYDVLKEIRFHPTDVDQSLAFTFLPALREMDQAALEKVHADQRLKMLYSIIANTTTVHSAATALMQNEPWDFLAVYHDAIDHFGHGFMKYHPPRNEWIPEDEFHVWKDVMESGYRYADLQLGAMVQLAGEDTTIIVMSDHGFHPDHLRPRAIPEEPAGPAVEHRQLGILVAAGPGIRRDERIYGASVIDICPTILHHFGLPIGEDMDGKVLSALWTDDHIRPEKSIGSWDDVAGDAGSHPPDKQIAPTDAKAALDQLVALGYIDEPNKDKSIARDETVRELDYNLACSFIDGEIYSEAINILERLYQKWPDEHRFGVKLTTAYSALTRTADLRQITEQLIERRLAEAEVAKSELTKRRLDDEDVRKAEEKRLSKMSDTEKEKYSQELRALLSRANPNLFTLHYHQAYADFAEKKYDTALTKLEQLDEDYGARSNALCLRGDIHLRRQDWSAANDAYRGALKIDGEQPGPNLGLARASLGERNFERAIEFARRSLGLLYHQPRGHFLHGMALFRCDRFEEAEQAFLISRQQAPLLAANYRMLAEIAQHYREDGAAAASYRAMIPQARKRARELRLGEIQSVAQNSELDQEIMQMPDLFLRADKHAGVSESEIITIVSGLPRSGTSLMMQILEAIGIEPYSDSQREADDSNPLGYYEHTRVARLLSDPDKQWLLDACGRAIKIVAPILPVLKSNIQGEDGAVVSFNYRLILMERPIAQIIESQRLMLERMGKQRTTAGLARTYRQQLHAARAWANNFEVPSLEVSYPELVNSPEKFGSSIGAFLSRPVDSDLLRQCVNPTLHRVRTA